MNLSNEAIRDNHKPIVVTNVPEEFVKELHKEQKEGNE